MPASLIRSRAMVPHAIDRHRWNEITDGAALQEDGRIVEIGTYQELCREHPNVDKAKLHETVRQWARKFGQQFANQIRRRLPRAGDK